MTKARDLAGFASSSVTTTASDGLVLKGDGSTTDVIIKNGANATVATVADGTTTLAATANLTAGGSITATGASVGALARGSIQVGNSSGVAAPLTIGSNAQLLQSNGTTAAWATVSTGPDDVVFPNLASPNNTYTSSGTWSKGSLSDDDYVWFYIVGGGGGGASQPYNGGSIFVQGGQGAAGILLYAKAKFFNGAAYVVGAGSAGKSTPSADAAAPTPSTLTLSSSNGSGFYSTGTLYYTPIPIFTQIEGKIITQSTTLVLATNNPSNVFTVPTLTPTGWSGAFTGDHSSYQWQGGVSGYQNAAGGNGIFGGGGGGGFHASEGSDNPNGGSLYAGAGGNVGNTGGAGSVPGGGGGGSKSYGTNGGNGGNGNIRVYHV